MTMTVGSLFSGIGGMDLAFERAGCKVVWQVELDDYATKVLEKHWPDVPRYRDIKEVTGEQLGYADIIVGGFPCTDISYAGKGAGIEGEQSGLWLEMLRVIREIRPRYVLVENVSALLDRGLGRVLGDLAESGYDAEWDCIPASAVGAPHRRDRVWIVAYPNCDDGRARGERTGREARPDAVGGGERPDVADAASLYGAAIKRLQPDGVLSVDVADAGDTDGRRADGSQNEGGRHQEAGGCCAPGDRPEHWDVEPPICELADELPKRVDGLDN